MPAPDTQRLAYVADLLALVTDAELDAYRSQVSNSFAGKADLVGGVIPTAQIPALALTATFTVASQAAMLALTSAQVQPGDVAVRTDGAGSFILTATNPAALASWTRLNAPTDVVTTVNGQKGDVVIAAAGSPFRTWDATAKTWPALNSPDAPVMFVSTNDAAATAPADQRVNYDMWVRHPDAAAL
jgi:hypothetical protein